MVMQGTDMKIAETPDDLSEYQMQDAYAEWLAREGVKVITEFAFEDLGDVELGPWERKGGSGAVVNIPNDHLTNDSHLVEIRPGGKSEPEHHMYEEFVYVISGRGATTIWFDDSNKQTFEWKAGSLFALPLNAWYQHFNGRGDEPARYLGVTTAPPMMRLYNDLDFIFDSPHAFTGRFDAQSNYFSGEGKLFQSRVWESNFIPNAPDMALYGWKQRGAGGINVMLEMAKNNSRAHISEFPVGTYKKAHRHGPGAHLLILSGEGFSMLWQEGTEYRKAPWKVGGMVIVPGDDMFHQHFNTGANAGPLPRHLQRHDGPAQASRQPRLARRQEREAGRLADRVRGRGPRHPRDLRGRSCEGRRDLPHEGVRLHLHRRSRPHQRARHLG